MICTGWCLNQDSQTGLECICFRNILKLERDKISTYPTTINTESSLLQSYCTSLSPFFCIPLPPFFELCTSSLMDMMIDTWRTSPSSPSFWVFAFCSNRWYLVYLCLLHLSQYWSHPQSVNPDLLISYLPALKPQGQQLVPWSFPQSSLRVSKKTFFSEFLDPVVRLQCVDCLLVWERFWVISDFHFWNSLLASTIDLFSAQCNLNDSSNPQSVVVQSVVVYGGCLLLDSWTWGWRLWGNLPKFGDMFWKMEWRNWPELADFCYQQADLNFLVWFVRATLSFLP